LMEINLKYFKLDWNSIEFSFRLRRTGRRQRKYYVYRRYPEGFWKIFGYAYEGCVPKFLIKLKDFQE